MIKYGELKQPLAQLKSIQTRAANKDDRHKDIVKAWLEQSRLYPDREKGERQ